MTAPNFGFIINRQNNESQPASNALMSVAGMAGPFGKAAGVLQAAFDAAFPLNTPVSITSTSTQAAMIDPASPIGDALSAINAQLADLQTTARVVIVRTAEGTSQNATTKLWETISNIVGNAAQKTGLYAFKRAGALVGVYPRLVCVPGYTTQRPSGLSELTLTDGGANLTEAPTVVFTGGGTDPAKRLPTAHAVLGSGDTADQVVALVIDDPGIGLVGALAVSFTGGGSELDKDLPTATATVSDLANPIVAALPAVLSSYLGIGVVDVDPDDDQGAIDDRETMQSMRLMTVTPEVDVLESGVVVKRPLSPRAIGLFIRRDFQNGGRPFGAIANQPVYGIVGPSRDVEFSLTDGDTEGQTLLGHQVGVLVRGESGDDFAISEGGFVFVGYDNVGEDLTWRQIHKVRGRDFIELTFLRTLRYYLGRYSLRQQTVQVCVNTVGNILAQACAKGEILGYEARFDPDLNNLDDLRTGKIYLRAKFEEAPMLRVIEVGSQPYAAAVEATLESLINSQALAEPV